MTLLIQDARRPLLGGIIDDGSLPSSDPPDVPASVDRFRSLRESPAGWMIGSLVAPAGALEALAGVLMHTMRPDEAPWTVTVEVDDGNVAPAAAFHAAMDPAASVTGALLPLPDAAAPTAIERSIAAARGIQPDALPLLSTAPGDLERTVRTVARSRERTLQPAGVVIDVTGDVPVEMLAATLLACVSDDVPVVVAGGSFPAVTASDATTGRVRYGVLNLLAVAAGGAGGSLADAAALLSSGGPFSAGFAGLDSPAGRIRATPGRPKARGPLVAIMTPYPAATLRSLESHTPQE